MKEVLSIIYSHPDANVRELACLVMIDATDNNIKLQAYALRLGALYLTRHFEKEQDMETKDAVFAAIYSLLKGENLEGKRLFIKEYDGLNFIERLIKQDQPLRLQCTIMELLFDLLSDKQLNQRSDDKVLRAF